MAAHRNERRWSPPTNGGQSGIGLPHSKTLRKEWHVRTSRQRRGVRQPYAAFNARDSSRFFVCFLLEFEPLHVGCYIGGNPIRSAAF